MDLNAVHTSIGFTDAERELVAVMYWAAFGQKLGRVMGPDQRALAYINDLLDPTHAICARSSSGELLGVAGFKSHESALVDGSWRDLTRHYGVLGSLWRAVLLSLLIRDTDNERFLMDGIFVADAAQGKGVGTALLDATCAEAINRGYTELRLDVINTNPRARALYEREGFVATDEHELGPLKYVFGFEAATSMIRKL